MGGMAEMYPRSFSGLLMSYTAAIPFFRNTVESDLLFSVGMFGLPVLLHAASKALQGDDHIAAA
jgi:hypothetical protein